MAGRRGLLGFAVGWDNPSWAMLVFEGLHSLCSLSLRVVISAQALAVYRDAGLPSLGLVLGLLAEVHIGHAAFVPAPPALHIDSLEVAWTVQWGAGEDSTVQMVCNLAMRQMACLILTAVGQHTAEDKSWGKAGILAVLALTKRSGICAGPA